MGDGRLRKPDPLLNISSAQTRSHRGWFRPASLFPVPMFESLQNSAPRGIGDGMQCPLQRGFVGRHRWIRNNAEIDGCQYTVRRAPPRNLSQHSSV